MTNFIELSFDSKVNNHGEFTCAPPRKTGANWEVNRITPAVVELINKLCLMAL